MPITLTRDLAMRASWDAANRAMRTAGRTQWSEEDAEVSRLEFLRLWPLCPHLIEPESLCAFCDQDIIPAGHPLSGKPAPTEQKALAFHGVKSRRPAPYQPGTKVNARRPIKG